MLSVLMLNILRQSKQRNSSKKMFCSITAIALRYTFTNVKEYYKVRHQAPISVQVWPGMLMDIDAILKRGDELKLSTVRDAANEE